MSSDTLVKTELRFSEQEFIKFLKDQGIVVKTNTKARGNLGICFKNRIDISKKAENEKRINILAHEYAHKIHYDMEKESFHKGGTLQKLFKTSETELFKQELIKITNFVDENSTFEKFYARKDNIKNEINALEKVIRKDYPDFKRTAIFKPISNYFRKNKSFARYLLKYDSVRIIQPVLKKAKMYSIMDLDNDFSEIPESLRAYIKLKSKEREHRRFYRAKNKAENYYKKPTELFARFIEGLFVDKTKIQELAPTTYSRFIELLNQGYYGNLKDLFILAKLDS